MKRTFYILATLFVAFLGLTACVGNDEEEVSNSNLCYIGSFSLGQMKRTVHTTTSSGADSTYTVSFKGAGYLMRIDQRTQVISNNDSLPMGTYLNAVIATITGTGSLIYTPLADTTQWKTYSSSDSIDFSRPLLFRVYTSDASSWRDYTVQVNVRQCDPNAYTWTAQADLPVDSGALSVCRVLPTDSGVTILGTDDSDGRVRCWQSTKIPVAAWTTYDCTGLPAAADVTSAQMFDGRYWMSGAQKLYTSTDAVTWEEVTPTDGTQLLSLVAASKTALHASVMTAEGTTAMAMTVDGTQWSAMEIETGGFTGRPAAAVAYEQKNGNRRVVMADAAQGSNQPFSIWNLLEGTEWTWTLFAQRGDNDYPLPARKHLNIFFYNDELVAVGGALANSTAEAAAAGAYVSHDNGITWELSDDMTLPAEVLNTKECVAANSEGGNIWLVNGARVWRGRLNSISE